ncbi:hypothetical protein KIN20_006739 [Parelaphostrongylus tenuis]|uniref:Uncharacterized protein n=1 Tax=Parelaphostrongylus tenuis TaxID=148309 RepID=A0AAD5QIK5_PARTN|nr:hypothetical protein KIN20_006739 [Parelaphostrongylus tenuis]
MELLQGVPNRQFYSANISTQTDQTLQKRSVIVFRIVADHWKYDDDFMIRCCIGIRGENDRKTDLIRWIASFQGSDGERAAGTVTGLTATGSLPSKCRRRHVSRMHATF